MVHVKTTAAIFVATLAAVTPASSETYKLTMASSHSTVLPWVGPLSTKVVAEANQRLEAKGSSDRIEWTESYAGALYGFSDTLEAVGDNITDGGWVGTLWEESKMPYQNVTYYTPFVTSDPALMSKTFNDLHDELDFMSDAWTEENQVFLGGSVADSYQLITNFPVNSVADLAGKKILAPGPSGAWITAIGAVPVSGALPTYYNQIETGVADGALTVVTGIVPLKLHEVAPFVTIADLGSTYFGGFAVNLDTWERVSDDVRSVLSELGLEYSADNVSQVSLRYSKFLDILEQDSSVTVTHLSDEERQKWAEMLPDLAATWAEKLPHGDELLQAFMGKIRASGGVPLRNWDNSAD